MPGNFRNNLQAAILYDGHAHISPSMDLNDFRMAMLDNGIPLRVVSEDPVNVKMYGPDELVLTCTYFHKPAEQAVFAPVLMSPVTQMMFPDAQERVQRHGSHVLIEVQQGMFAGVEDDPDIAALLASSGIPRVGRDLGSFNRRVDILAEACLFLHREKPASAVHWTQSNTLISGEALEGFVKQSRPGFLTVHPLIIGGDKIPEHKVPPVEVFTAGAADYIGREIHTDLAPIPWVDIYGSITAFMNVAIMPNGYIIPDGDTFGVESGEFAWRVTHPDGKNNKTINGQPFYNLKLLYHRDHGYTAPDFSGREVIKGGIPEASELLEGPEQAVREQIDGWRKTEAMARKAGGGFEIYRTKDIATGPVGMSAQPKTSFGSGGGRPTGVFGKRKS